MSQETMDLWDAATELPDAPEWLTTLRAQSLAKFRSVGWPSKKADEYRYSDLSGLQGGAPLATPGSVSEEQIKPFLTGDEIARIVFVDGRFNAELSNLPAIEGLVAGPMSVGFEYEQTKHHFNSLAASDDPLELLHCATWQDGAFILAEKPVEGTVHIMCVNTGAPGLRSLHHAIIADQSASVRVVESHVHVADNEAATFSFAVLVGGVNGAIHHVKIQKEDRRARHIGSQRNLILRDGRVHSTLIDIGGQQARQATSAQLLQEGSEVDLQGVFFGQRDQRTDVWTRVDHMVPHCRSNELFKGIMDDKARGAFTGLVRVHPGAHHTESEQENRNLLLSREAHIDASPQLIIDNDDVKCSHGSTIGQLDESHLFFLRARGIGEDRARMMLTRAFASEVLESVTDDATRKLLDRYLHVWFIKHQEHLA